MTKTFADLLIDLGSAQDRVEDQKKEIIERFCPVQVGQVVTASRMFRYKTEGQIKITSRDIRTVNTKDEGWTEWYCEGRFLKKDGTPGPVKGWFVWDIHHPYHDLLVEFFPELINQSIQPSEYRFGIAYMFKEFSRGPVCIGWKRWGCLDGCICGRFQSKYDASTFLKSGINGESPWISMLNIEDSEPIKDAFMIEQHPEIFPI